MNDKQGRFDIPPDDPFFWGDYPFGAEVEQQQREQDADSKPSWIQETQEQRRRERDEERSR